MTRKPRNRSGVSQHSKVVNFPSSSVRGPELPDDDDEETVDQYIADRIADLLVLVGNLYQLDSAQAGNKIIDAVVWALEDGDVHVAQDLQPLRMLMELSEEIEAKLQAEDSEARPGAGTAPSDEDGA
jgi:hypothetical protein